MENAHFWYLDIHSLFKFKKLKINLKINLKNYASMNDFICNK